MANFMPSPDHLLFFSQRFDSVQQGLQDFAEAQQKRSEATNG